MSEHARQHPFFVNRVRLESERSHLTGAEIKEKAEVPSAYDLFLAEEGDTPDKAIRDDDGVDLVGKIRHFYSEEKHPKEYPFFVDAVRYETEQSSLTGAEIKKRANVTETYQLFLEEEGDDPDKAVSDGEAVNLEGRIKHFYAVPPATFGAK